MVTRYSKQGCTIETKFIIQPNGEVREEIELSVDPTSKLSLVTEERASLLAGTPFKASKPSFRR